MQREPIIFTAAKDFNPQRKFYISDDELDWVVRAGPVDYRLDVYSYFANHTDAKDREHFLSHYHGEYSGSSGGNNDLSYTYKRLRFSHGSILEPYAQIELSWRKVLKRVENLLQNNSFLYESDRAEMAEYELKKLARTIHSFFRGAPDIFQRPYSADETFEYWENIKSIQNLLKSPAGVAEIQAMMQPLWEWTQKDSADYTPRKTAMGAMQAYRDGTYSVFGKLNTQYQLPKVQEPVPDPLETAKQLINEYCQEVFEQDADFTDLSHVDLAMGATSDSEHTIEIHADLTAFRLVYRVDGETVHKVECKDLQELNEYLANLEFDEMIAHAEERYLVGPEDYFDDINPAEIREKLAQRGIVDGKVVDPEALDNDPFIQQVVADAEAMEQEQPAVLAPPQAKPKREYITFEPLYPDIPKEQRNNFRITDPDLGHGSAGQKYAANVAAIRMLKRIEDEGRLATPVEQEVLSRYVGWGGLADCFDEKHHKYPELKALLSEEEFADARASSLTAFYTSPVIIQSMYQALEQMGFKEGNILEPSCGVGNFLGMIPDSMAGSKTYGVELDSISGRIAQQLYQNSSIAVTGFEKVQMPDSFFDVAIGNVPFGDFKVLDKRYDKHHWLIHDYFFGKTLDKVRPGGIVAFITSKGTMDKENSAVRKYLAQRADLIGAIRLPNDAFKRNAGTEVTSDILFLQKRDRMTDIEPDWVHLDTDPNGIRMNSYFVQHPEMVLGKMVMESTRFGMDSTCKPYPEKDLGRQLAEAVSTLNAQITEYQYEELEEDDRSIPADPNVRNFSYTIVDGKDVRIFDTKIDANGNEVRVLNKKETAIAQDRQELIKAKFAEWIWKDIDRRERLCGIYNELFNSLRPREYDGQHIRFSGMNPEISLRKHQINAIAHIMYGGNTLLAHEVGAGKTFEMVAAAMESKRLGLCTKSLIVVPNHITEQWAAEWLQLYPSANILVATKKDFETKNRKKFCGRIATGDYDAIIIGHSQFEKIPMSKERQEAILRRQIDSILDGIREAKRNHAENYSIKQMERTRKSLENRLAKLNDQSRKDDVVTFEQLGVDRIFVDESHYFKNLFLATKMRNVGGIAQTEAQKSSDLFMKCQYLDEITGGRGVIFATGTPISNSMVELYTIQRYLQYSTLEEMGLLNFDDWAANYGETITAIELSPEGTGYRSKTRFAKFYNLPELMSTFKMVADIQTADMLKLPVPKANFHTEVIKPSPMQQDMIKSLADRAEEIRAGKVDPSVDNMLRITNDGRKLALDMRLVQSLAPDEENGKVSICARNVYSIWERTQEQRSTQMIFCDLSTPKSDGSFNVYDDLKKKLVAKGIPPEEIAFIHDANTEARKKELFSKVRSGQVRILMGSTAKMGAGTNCQDKLIALHDVDCPWRPSDLAQRLGRIVRQGNQNPEVEIFRYVTENTFDAYLYQLVENKQKFIAQIMTSKAPARIADDVDETALSYSEIKALATGNPLIIEKCNLDVEVSKLNMLKANHLNQRFSLENMVYRRYPAKIAELKEQIAGYEKDVATAKAHPKSTENFVGMEIYGTCHSEKEAAGRAIINACTDLQGSEPVQLGQYRGFSLSLQYIAASTDYKLTIKGAMSHTISLGADIYGNITRMDNVVDGLAKDLEAYQSALQDTQTQLANAKTEMETPFAREKELAEKSARLKELNILLNMDQKDRSVLDDGPAEESLEKEKQREQER